MTGSAQAISYTTDDLLPIIEDCLDNYASDAHLSQSPLAAWEIVKCRLPVGIASNPELLALTVRAVLDDLIDALHSPAGFDLNSPSVRQYIIADHLFRRGLKQSEICASHLPLSKSQFYRERADTLLTLTSYVHLWEQHTVESRKQTLIRTLALSSPVSCACVIGVDSLKTQLTTALVSPDGPPLIMLSGVAGLGKTAVAQSVVEHILHADHFHALGWVNCQRERFIGTYIQSVDAPILTMDDFFNNLLRQLLPHSLSHNRLFDLVTTQVQSEKVSFNQILDFIQQELDGQEPCRLPLSEKQSLVRDLLWTTPTLVVVDGLEAVSTPLSLIEDLIQVVSSTNSKVLVTSRARFSECHNVRHFDLVPLGDLDAIHLIQRHAAECGVEAIQQASSQELQEMVHAAGSNPLIIKWMVTQLAALPVSQVLSDLSQVTGSSCDIYNFIYQHTWETLSAFAQKVLVAIADSSSSETTWGDLQADTGIRPEVLNRSLQELVESSLVPVSVSANPFYQICSPTRTFALARAGYMLHPR